MRTITWAKLNGLAKILFKLNEILWGNYKSFNNSSTFQYSRSNRMDTFLIPILLVEFSFVGCPPPTSHYALNSTSLNMSTTITFGGGKPISRTPSNATKSLQNSWSLGNHLLCWHVYTFFCSALNLWDIVCVEQMGHLRYPLVVNPEIVPYISKSWIVHNTMARNINWCSSCTLFASCSYFIIVLSSQWGCLH